MRLSELKKDDKNLRFGQAIYNALRNEKDFNDIERQRAYILNRLFYIDDEKLQELLE